MHRLFAAIGLAILLPLAAQAHFPFIVPSEDGSKAQVVFSDTLAPDTRVAIEKLGNAKMFLRDSSGKDSALTWKKGDGFYEMKLPGKGPRTAFGLVEYGVLQKGDAKPFRLVYLPKAILSEPGKPIGGPLQVEIVPQVAQGKVRFLVLREGKPAPEIEVTVILPGNEKKTAKTDKTGLTPAYEPKGRYGAFARLTEAKTGEFAGKKYTEIRYYATLVTDVK